MEFLLVLYVQHQNYSIAWCLTRIVKVRNDCGEIDCVHIEMLYFLDLFDKLIPTALNITKLHEKENRFQSANQSGWTKTDIHSAVSKTTKYSSIMLRYRWSLPIVRAPCALAPSFKKYSLLHFYDLSSKSFISCVHAGPCRFCSVFCKILANNSGWNYVFNSENDDSLSESLRHYEEAASACYLIGDILRSRLDREMWVDAYVWDIPSYPLDSDDVERSASLLPFVAFNTSLFVGVTSDRWALG